MLRQPKYETAYMQAIARQHRIHTVIYAAIPAALILSVTGAFLFAANLPV